MSRYSPAIGGGRAHLSPGGWHEKESPTPSHVMYHTITTTPAPFGTIESSNTKPHHKIPSRYYKQKTQITCEISNNHVILNRAVQIVIVYLGHRYYIIIKHRGVGGTKSPSPEKGLHQ